MRCGPGVNRKMSSAIRSASHFLSIHQLCRAENNARRRSGRIVLLTTWGRVNDTGTQNTISKRQPPLGRSLCMAHIVIIWESHMVLFGHAQECFRMDCVSSSDMYSWLSTHTHSHRVWCGVGKIGRSLMNVILCVYVLCGDTARISNITIHPFLIICTANTGNDADVWCRLKICAAKTLNICRNRKYGKQCSCVFWIHHEIPSQGK